MKPEILYVDDERENLVVFEAAFEDNFTVLTANNGLDALEIVEREPVRVVVADQRMPGMSGVQLFEVLRRKHPHIKRIMLTGYADSNAMLDAINTGQVFHFVTKPWERSLLLPILLRAVEAHDMGMANAALTDRLVASQRCATLGQAAARIAHEMGNSLGVLPLLELIEDKYADHEDLSQMAGFTSQLHERLASLVNEIKAFVHFEQEEAPRHPTSLAEAVHEVVSMLRFDESIPLKRLTVDISADSVVLVNKVKIQQVIVNLLKNAAHAIRGADEGRITLTLDRRDDHASLTVADNGHGIPAKLLERIWEPFFTTKGSEGTGLGLDICRRLIENHEGEISCQSSDAGTSFQIQLPLYFHETADAENETSVAVTGEGR